MYSVTVYKTICIYYDCVKYKNPFCNKQHHGRTQKNAIHVSFTHVPLSFYCFRKLYSQVVVNTGIVYTGFPTYMFVELFHQL